MPLSFLSRKFKPYYQPNTPGRKIRSVVIPILLGFLFYQAITGFLVSSHRIESVSMEPSFSPGDRIFVSKLAYGSFIPFAAERLPGLGSPRRGDVVIMIPPYYREASGLEAFLGPVISFLTFNRYRPAFTSRLPWENPHVIKRVIGVPGDILVVRDHVAYIRSADSTRYLPEFELSGTRYTNRIAPLPEGWSASLPFSGNVAEVLLAEDEYFVLGDNRSESSDSRYWGAVSADRIIGKVVATYWPFGSIGVP